MSKEVDQFCIVCELGHGYENRWTWKKGEPISCGWAPTMPEDIPAQHYDEVIQAAQEGMLVFLYELATVRGKSITHINPETGKSMLIEPRTKH